MITRIIRNMYTGRWSKPTARSLSLLMAAVLILSGSCGGISAETAVTKTLIVDELDASEMSVDSTPDESSTQFQSLYAYANEELTFSDLSTTDNYTTMELIGSVDDYTIIQSYVELLTDCMNMEVVENYEKAYSSDSFFLSWALNYTGTAKVTETHKMPFVDDVMGNVALGCYTKNNKLKVTLYIPASMEEVDMGWRSDGEAADTTIVGESAGAGLYLLSDGSYQTSDGRLTTTVGNAYILMDGEEYISEAGYQISSLKEVLTIENFYQTESVYFAVPYQQLITGDIYTYDDVRGDYTTYERYNWEPVSGKPTFAIYHNDNWRYARYNSSYFEACTIRAMYYEEDVVAVIYIYAMLTTAPCEIEILAAVDLSTAKTEENNDGSTSSSGSSSSSSSSSTSSKSSGVTVKCTKCHGKGTITCTACDGEGGKYVYGSVPNYSGKSSTATRTWQRCSKCSGTRKQTCTRCKGSGTE